jgi:hypothetical protein
VLVGGGAMTDWTDEPTVIVTRETIDDLRSADPLRVYRHRAVTPSPMPEGELTETREIEIPRELIEMTE